MFQPPKELIQYIRQAREVLVISHIAPDGDAIGSVLGMGAMLRQLGKNPVLAMQDPVPDSFTYLPMSGSITSDPFGNFDLILGLDASSPDRFGDVYREEFASLPLVVIDHHITNTNFGTVNWVEPGAVATAELIFDLATAMEVPWTVEMALPLLNGLVTDTLCFRTPNVVPRTLEVAAELMKAGASLPLVTENALSRKPLSVVRLWAKTLPTVDLRGKILYAEVPYQVRQSVGNTEGNSNRV
jgi:phosphoesterase RecJ-like protein